jgi:hypothetical protein
MAGALSRLASWARGLRPAWQAAAAFAAYLAASFVIFALPLASDLGTRYVGMGRADSKLYEWSLAWTPYALGNGVSPLTTDHVFAPAGVGLSWTTFLPGPSLVMWPVTELFGTLVSLNALMILAPALAAWASYLVCRRVTGSFWPSVAGGYLFGFSTYMAAHMQGHLNLVLVFPIPLMVYLVIRRTEGSLGPIAFTAWFAAALVGLFSISTELVATAALFGAIAYAFALIAAHGLRKRLLATGGLVAAAGLVAGLLLSPYISMALRDTPTDAVRPLDRASVDLYSFVTPRETTLILGERYESLTDRFTTTPIEDAGYIGVPLVTMLAVFSVTRIKRRETPALVGFVLLGSVLAMGPVLHVAGVERGWLIGTWVSELPLFEHAPSQRFPMYTALALGVVAALWLAQGSRRWAPARWATVVAGAAMLLPYVPGAALHPPQNLPAFIANGTYRQVIERGENVLAITDLAGSEMAWQAAADFWFRMPQGYVGPVPPPYEGIQLSRGLAWDQKNPYMPAVATFSQWLNEKGVTAILLHDSARWQFRPLLSRVGATATYEGGDVSVWRPGVAGYTVRDEALVTHTGDLDVLGTVVNGFSMPSFRNDEARITAKDLQGRPIVFAFIGPDCIECHTHVDALAAYGINNPDVAIVAVVSFYDQREEVRSLSTCLTPISGSDPTGRLATAFGANDLPFTVVLNADHSIEQTWSEPFLTDVPAGFGPATPS